MSDIKMTSDIQQLYSLLRGDGTEQFAIDREFIEDIANTYTYLNQFAIDSDTDDESNYRSNPSDMSNSPSFFDKKYLFLKSSLPYQGNKFSLLENINAVMPSKFGSFYDLFAGGGSVFSNIRALADNKRINNQTINIKANDILLPLAMMHRFFVRASPQKIVEQVYDIQLELFKGAGMRDAYINNETLNLSADRYQDTRKRLYLNIIKATKAAVRMIYEISREDEALATSTGPSKAERLDSIQNFVGAAYYVLFKNTHHSRLVTRPLTDEASIDSLLQGTPGFDKYIKPAHLHALYIYCTMLQKHLKTSLSRVSITNESYTDTRPDALNSGDLVYLDPPYLITMAVYNSFWTEESDCSLYNYIDSLTNISHAKVILSNVIMHKQTHYNPILLNWIKSDLKKDMPQYKTFYFEKRYPNSGGLSYEILTVNFDDFQVSEQIRKKLGMHPLNLEKVDEIETRFTPLTQSRR